MIIKGPQCDRIDERGVTSKTCLSMLTEDRLNTSSVTTTGTTFRNTELAISVAW